MKTTNKLSWVEQHEKISQEGRAHPQPPTRDQIDHPDKYETCTTCNGDGIIDRDVYVSDVGWVAKLTECSDCEGTGKELTQEAFDALVKAMASASSLGISLGCEQ